MPDKVKSEIADYVEYLQKRVRGVKWEKESRFHITLKFLGDIESSLLPGLKSVLHNTSQNFKYMRLEVTKLSGIPNLRLPRVIILSLNYNERFTALHDSIQKSIYEKLEISRDTRIFYPHITIGRVKGDFRIDEKLNPIDNINFNINKITLTRSKLTQKDSIYSNLDVYNLT